MSIEVVPCSEHNCVDLRDSRYPDREEVLHLSAAEWAEFLSAVKAGMFDHVCGLPRAIQGPPDAELRGLLPSGQASFQGRLTVGQCVRQAVENREQSVHARVHQDPADRRAPRRDAQFPAADIRVPQRHDQGALIACQSQSRMAVRSTR